MGKSVDFYEIYGYYYSSLWESMWFKILIISLVICVLGVLFFWLWWNKKNKKLAPWDWALAELSKFSIKKFSNQEEYKDFYFALTSIVKSYLSKRYGWSVESKTDSELIKWLEKQKFDREIIDMLSKIAEGASWIKFANADVLRSQAEADLQSVLTMVNRTKMDVSQ